MVNIWGFLLQTLSVSLAAILLLVIKRIFEDKLSPRWQYGVFLLLALRIVIPVGIARYILLPLPVWIETLKGVAEKNLASAYAAAYEPITFDHILPTFGSAPASITDWIFVVYAAGIIVNLVGYLISYIRLRLRLGKGTTLTPEMEAQIVRVAEKYGLKACKGVQMEGLPSPFVCGIFRPVLAIPAEKLPDDKVILHELLHLKYGDALQSTVWTILRAFHWCNPFLQMVFNRITNDMEALCDQRVLERLEGEERREYGVILLSMANQPYARAAGTTSISNGSKNIAQRIESIVRFKKYPKGMALVSVCIVIMLGTPILWGTPSAATQYDYLPVKVQELDKALAMTRINRCTTVAGALDTYAKGLMTENGVYIATASSLSKQDDLAKEMLRNATEEDWVVYHLDSGDELNYVDMQEEYRILNLKKKDDGSYSAHIAIAVSAFLNEDGIGWREDTEGNPRSGSVLVPVKVMFEDAWVVEETGKRIISYLEPAELAYEELQIPALKEFRGEGETGTVVTRVSTVHTVENVVQTSGANIFTPQGFSATLKNSAEFDFVTVHNMTRYKMYEGMEGPKEFAAIEVLELTSPEEDREFEWPLGLLDKGAEGAVSGSVTNGYSYSTRPIDESWTGEITEGSGSGFSDPEESDLYLPQGIKVRITWDGEIMEELTLEEAAE